MKNFIIVCFLLLLVPSVVFGADFVPTKLELSAAEYIQYGFDGSDLDIPVHVSGTPARVVFLVYTKGKGEEIGELRNGYLGWHYVNGIDTCMYVSRGQDFGPGDNVITWDGKDADGGVVPEGNYTYYLWAYDYASPKHKATHNNITMERGRLNLVPFDMDGMAFENPRIYTIELPVFNGGKVFASNWVIGNDPEDGTLRQTTELDIPAEWQWFLRGQVALNPEDYNIFYVGLQRQNPTTKGVWKFEWIPDGMAQRDNSWSSDMEWAVEMDKGLDVISDGNYLYTAAYAQASVEPASKFFIIDFEGFIVDSFNLEWWISQDEKDRGGALNGGPRLISHCYGATFLNNYFCLQQQVDPMRYMDTGDMADFTVWCNLNGDYFDDLCFEETNSRPWVCFGGSAAEINSCYSDRYYFSQTPQYDMGAVSFVLMGPDGTGIDYFTFAGETAGYKKGSVFVQTDGAYDGCYTDNEAAESDQNGIWFIGQDSLKGTISSTVAVAEDSPAEFSVAQNSPNPFNPTTSISFTINKADNVTVDVFNIAGQKVDTLVNEFMDSGSHSAVWDASGFSAGVYFYTVKSGDFSKTMKMTLIK